MVMPFHRWPTNLLVTAAFLHLAFMTTPVHADPPDRAEVLGVPRAPNLPPDIAQRFSSLEFEERELMRATNVVETDRMITLALYIGGVGLTIGSVAMLVSAVLQGACVSDDFGCYSAREFIMGGIPVALVGGVLLSGAALTDARIGIRERTLDARRESLEERRRSLERSVGLALGPASVELRISF
jgi:hypothetical protein